MGSYGISTTEIIESLDEALDNLEGDFSEKQLFKALKIMKLYPFVSDNKKSVPVYVKAKREIDFGGQR